MTIPQDECLAFLVRHGATDSNLADPPILQGRAVDGPLSGPGRQQAAAAAGALSPHNLAAVYASPLRRARETAQAIAGAHQLDVLTLNELTEADVGNWERRSWVEIRETESEAYHRFQDDPATHGYPGGENLRDVLRRVVPTIDATMDQHAGNVIAIVAHNVVNRVYLANALEVPLKRARQIAQANCGINLLRRREGRTKIITLNSVMHLPYEGLAAPKDLGMPSSGISSPSCSSRRQ